MIDLCTTCVYGPTCTRRVYAGVPIWYCNEFDDSDAPSGVLRAPENPAQPVEDETSDTSPKEPDSVNSSCDEAGEEPDLKGLCVNCENRRSCLMPKPEGGVWHCEEYL